MNNNLPPSLTRMVLHQCVLPSLTSGAKTWRLTKDLEGKRSSSRRGWREKHGEIESEHYGLGKNFEDFLPTDRQEK